MMYQIILPSVYFDRRYFPTFSFFIVYNKKLNFRTYRVSFNYFR